MSPRGTHRCGPPSRFSPGRNLHPGPCPGPPSELGDQLRPDRDHSDKQRDRRQRRRFFHEYLQHRRLLDWNIKRTLFFFCSLVKRWWWVSLKSNPEINHLVNGTRAEREPAFKIALREFRFQFRTLQRAEPSSALPCYFWRRRP